MLYYVKAVSIPLITEDVKLADVIKNSVSFFTNIANMIFKDLKRGVSFLGDCLSVENAGAEI